MTQQHRLQKFKTTSAPVDLSALEGLRELSDEDEPRASGYPKADSHKKCAGSALNKDISDLKIMVRQMSDNITTLMAKVDDINAKVTKFEKMLPVVNASSFSGGMPPMRSTREVHH